jgi:RNA polymerase sigma-70 factor, ECF subfamily
LLVMSPFAQVRFVSSPPNRIRGCRLFPFVTVLVLDPARGVERLVSREEEFRAFYATEYSGLARYCHSLLSDRELAHDLAQEAFTRMLGRFTKVDDPRAYVYGVATNLVRRAWRRRVQDGAVMAALAAQPVRPLPSRDGAIAVREAVERLPGRLRDVVLLHYWADLTVEAVAAAVGRPVGTVKRQLSEARAALAPEVTDE